MTSELIKKIRSVPMTDITAWKRTLKDIAAKHGIDEKTVVRIYHAKTADGLLEAAEG